MKRLHLVARYMEGFFHQYLGMLRGHSDKTILAYRDALKLLFRFAAERLKQAVDRLTIEDLSEKVILAFLDHIETSRHCCVRTRNARLAAISTFFNFVGREEPALLPQCHRIRTIPRKRGQHRTIDYLDEKEIQSIMDSVDLNARTGMRDRALLIFLFNTGARVQEIVDLPLDQVRLDAQGQVNLVGKGRKERSCPLWPETVTAVNAYLRSREPEDPREQRLFLNSNGRPITRFGVRHLVQRYAEMAAERCPTIQQKTIGPHTFRHSTAMHMLRAGNDINMVAHWLGHADTNTTHMYVEIDIEMKRKMLAQCAPPTNNSARRQWQEPKVIQWLNALSRRAELCEAK